MPATSVISADATAITLSDYSFTSLNDLTAQFIPRLAMSVYVSLSLSARVYVCVCLCVCVCMCVYACVCLRVCLYVCVVLIIIAAMYVYVRKLLHRTHSTNVLLTQIEFPAVTRRLRFSHVITWSRVKLEPAVRNISIWRPTVLESCRLEKMERLMYTLENSTSLIYRFI